MQLQVQWIAATSVPALSWTEPRVGRYFDVKPHPGLVTQFDIPEPYLVAPYTLRPSDGFYRLLTRDSNIFSREITRLPSDPLEMGAGTGTINAVSGELFPGVLLTRVKATIDIDGSDVENGNFRKLYSLRSSRRIPAVDYALRMVSFLAHGDRNANFQAFRYPEAAFFGIQFRLDFPALDFQESVAKDIDKIVALLIGTNEPRTLGKDIVENIIAENDGINQKSRVEYLVINRQGALYLLPAEKYRGPHTRRFDRTMDLASLAMFSAAFFQNSAHSGHHPVYNQFIGERLSHWVEAPRLVFKSSESNKLTWDALSHSLALQDNLDRWQAQLDSDKYRQSINRFRSAPPDWWLDSEFPQLLEMQSAPDRTGVKCIKDSSLREFVMTDRLESARCRVAGNYRASVVMAGVAIEGVLLDIVVNSSTMSRTNALKLGFQELIEAACPGFRDDPQNTRSAQRYIALKTAQILDSVCRKWRNYVHPGVALRSGDEVTKAAADYAIAALDLLLEELT